MDEPVNTTIIDERARFKTMRVLVLGVVLVGAGIFFTVFLFKNQQKSKASEAFANITMSSSLGDSSPLVLPGQTVDVSISIKQTGGKGISGIDLSLNNPGLSFVDPTVGQYSIDVNKAFSETILLDQQTDSAGKVTLGRLVMFAKKKKALLSKGFVLKFRYTVSENYSKGDFLPIVRVVLDPAQSKISGPNINDNLYTIDPATKIIISFKYDATNIIKPSPILCRGSGGSTDSCPKGYLCQEPPVVDCPPDGPCPQMLPYCILDLRVTPTPAEDVQCGNSVCNTGEECYYPPAPTCQVVFGQMTSCAANLLPYCRPVATPTNGV